MSLPFIKRFGYNGESIFEKQF